MNWKQLYASATPAERLEAVQLMLRILEARPEIVIVYIDLRRILLRGAFLGIFGMITLTTAFITLQADSTLEVPSLVMYFVTFFSIFAFKTRRSSPVVQTVHYV